MMGALTPSSGFCGSDTFSFNKIKSDDTLMRLAPDIKILAKTDDKDCNPDFFKLSFYRLESTVADDFNKAETGFDRAPTIRLVNHATVSGNNWRFQLVRSEFVVRVAENEVRDFNDAQEEEIFKQTLIGTFVRAVKYVVMIHQQQMILQVQMGSELMEIKQAHRLDYPGYNPCNEDCVICRTEDLMLELENFVAMAKLSSRPEPYGELGAGILERIMMEVQDKPLFLLNTVFMNALYVIGLELAREEMALFSASKIHSLNKLERLHGIYRFISRSKFEPNESLENISNFKLIGRYPTTAKLFRQAEPDISGQGICIYLGINMRVCTSLTTKIPIRMLNWDGNEVSLSYAVPRNVRFTHVIKNTAFQMGRGIGDRKMIFPEDKYDEMNEEFFIKSNMDVSEMNDITDLAIYFDMANNAARTIIC